jgi:hypothetical protein
MPAPYKLKKPLTTRNQLNRFIKFSHEKAVEDRKQAWETYQFFKKEVADNNRESDKEQMMAALKLLQTSTANLTKLIDVVSKITAEDSPFEKLTPSFQDLLKNDKKLKPRLPGSGPSLQEDSND